MKQHIMTESTDEKHLLRYLQMQRFTSLFPLTGTVIELVIEFSAIKRDCKFSLHWIDRD